jgi:hypothetical protein
MNEVTVFISYSHDSAAHRDRVLGLSERLRQDGIPTLLDRYLEQGSPPEGWPRWMLNGLDTATQVLCVCTETYYRRFRGLEVPDQGKGVDWEGALITQTLYDARSRSHQFIPLLFDRADEPHIPEPLRPHTHYLLNCEEAYQALYDALLAQAGVQPGAIGELKRKPRATGLALRFPHPTKLPDPFTPDTDRILRYAPEQPLGYESINIPQMRIQKSIQIELFDGSPLSRTVLYWELPPMSSRFGAVATLYSPTWKKIHTHSEQIYSAFRYAHIQLLLCHERKDQHGAETAAGLCELAVRKFRDFFEDEIPKYPVEVSNAEHLIALKNAEKGFSAMFWILANSKPGSDQFKPAIIFVERLCEWCFDTLRRADRVLEKHFETKNERI